MYSKITQEEEEGLLTVHNEWHKDAGSHRNDPDRRVLPHEG